MGHILNLYHTHHGTVFENGGDPNQCPELVDGSNSDVCGDYVEDTPADPFLGNGTVNNSCVWTYQGLYFDCNNDAYTADTHLIMSYSPPHCMEYFSPLQVVRMKNSIENLQVLQNVLASISGPNFIYDSAVFCLNTPSSVTINWSLSGTNASNYIIHSDTPSTNHCTIIKRDSVDFNTGNNLVLTAHVMRNGTEVATLTKPLTSVFCIGATIPCYQESYQIENIPSDCTVSWTWNGTGMVVDNSPNLIEPYYSQNNYFTLHRNNQGYGRGTLTATIMSDNDTLGTIVKTIDTGAYFSGTWKQGSGTPAALECGNIYTFTKGAIVTLTSSKFIGTTATSTTSGIGLWSGLIHNDSTIIFFTDSNFPLSNQSPNANPPGGYVTITVKDNVTCECYKFTFNQELVHPLMSSLNVSSSGSEFTFTLEGDSAKEKSVQPWQIEVMQFETGRTVCHKSSDNGKATINTSGWKAGIYVVMAIVDGQVVDGKKIVVK